MSRICWSIALFAFPIALNAQSVVRDTSPHTQRFISVEPSVSLEVLDWGGTGRPVVLLAGRGNTAHVFDDLAPKLKRDYRVYGITRRGYGNSTRTTAGFLADSLGDDVLAVMDSLGIRRPVLIGHSIAGQELSSIGSRHPERVAGLVYLDAGFHFAFYDPAAGRAPVLLRDTQRKLSRLADPSVAMTLRERQALISELLQSIPVLERDLRLLQQDYAKRPDKSRVFPVPDTSAVDRALGMGQQKYTSIRAPVLAIFALPREIPPEFTRDSSSRAEWDSLNFAGLSPQIDAFERGIPGARVVRIPHANHAVFRSHEADVLREIHAFIAGLWDPVAAASEPAACRVRADSLAYLVDGKPATCASAMAIPRSRIESVEVLKGAAARLRHPGSAEGVVLIQTKQDR